MSDGDTYEILDDMPETPRLPGQVVLSEDADQALDAVGADIVSQAKVTEKAVSKEELMKQDDEDVAA